MKPIAYQPDDTALHDLHPLVKGMWLVAMTIAVFVTKNALVVVGAAVGCLLAFRLSHLKLRERRGARLLLATTATLALLQVLFRHEGTVLIRLGRTAITDAALHYGVYVAGRFATVVLLSYLFVLTTDPSDLAYALMRVGLPYRYGFTMITALRLVPMFELEARTVYQAQLARGIAHDRRSPKRLLQWMRRLLMPVLTSALTKVDALATSMEGRGFGRLRERTFLRTTAFTGNDGLALAMLALLLVTGFLLS